MYPWHIYTCKLCFLVQILTSYHGYHSFKPCVLSFAALKSYMLRCGATQPRAILNRSANAASVFYCNKKYWKPNAIADANAAANAPGVFPAN